MKTAMVYLVGAGPGNPDLLTLRAARLLNETDVLVYDQLVHSHILNLVPSHVEKIYVGKQAGQHSLPQEEINKLLARLAKQGKKVVRLKGGDPFIFGRGGEEIAELMRENVPFEVVPGITAACGAAAYAGIPLTHRDYAQACLFVTGHLKNGSCDLDWPALVRPQQTVVIYMGIGALPEIRRQLLAHGMAPTTPAAIVRNATLDDQENWITTLQELEICISLRPIKPPALLILGNVVTLHPQLTWFKQS